MVRYSELQNYVSVYTRDSIRDTRRLDNKRPIIIFPENFYKTTLKMCIEENRENSGAFVTRLAKNGNQENYSVEGMIMLGYGSGGSVEKDPKRMNAVNMIPQIFSGINLIEFHTHPSALGSVWSDRFSDFGQGNGGDFDVFFGVINRAPKYKHVLFTGTNILTFGLDRPQFVVMDLEAKGLNPMASYRNWNNLFEEYLKIF